VSQIGVVIPEIQPSKLKAAKSLKSSFRRHFEATTAPAFFEKLKSTVGSNFYEKENEQRY